MSSKLGTHPIFMKVSVERWIQIWDVSLIFNFSQYFLSKRYVTVTLPEAGHAAGADVPVVPQY